MKFTPNKFNLMNSKGQAALVDSMFFIAIVSAICTGLFYFAINYGLGTEALLVSFYSSDFAMDSLKVITYINVMRDGSPVEANPTSPSAYYEYDYLLALVKEDYAKSPTKTLSPKTRVAIANTLYSVLKPFDDSIDYAFYIAKQGETAADVKFVALIIATHEKTDPTAPQVNRVFYSCDPSAKNVLEKYVFSSVGKVDSAIGKISLFDSRDSSSVYVIGLHTWISKNVEALKRDKLIATSSEFGCKEMPEVKIQVA